MHQSYSSDTIYRFLDELCARDKTAEQVREASDESIGVKWQVEQVSFEHTKAVMGGQVTVAFYDTSTLYFESQEDDVRVPGYSKDGKNENPQVVLGLLVGTGGNPIGYELHKGNQYEGTTLLPIVKKLEKRFNLSHPMIVADAGLLSEKNIEQLEQAAKQNADVQNRRSIETGNLIDGLKQQLATVSAMAEDYKRKYNSLSMDGNEKAASFARITAERDDAKAELKRTQVTLQKKQHEAQAMSDAINEKDRRIASLAQQVEELEKRLQAAPAAQVPTIQDDPAMSAIDDIDWDDDGSMPPHPGEDPRQLSLF